MRLLDKYIIYSSIFALFTESFKFHYIIDIKLFYFIILFNAIILTFNNKIYLNKNLFIIVSFLILHGFLSFVFFHSPINSLISQIIGISISSVFYYSVLKCYGKKLAFNIYLKIAYGVAFLAIPMYYLKINQEFGGDRLNGVLSEPAHYAAIMLPAAYVLLKRKNFFKFAIVIITIILSKSSIGYLGLFLMLFLPLMKAKYFLKYFIASLIVFGTGFYYLHANWDQDVNSEDSNFFIRRAKQTIESFSAIEDGKFKQFTNLSSYALLSNIYITKESFINYPFGSGLGSYESQYEKYYSQMTPPNYLVTIGYSKINKTDANSLLLRLVVDIGVFSFLFITYFVYRTIKVFRSQNKVMEQGVFFYLIIKLIREGHYFPPEFYFFLLIFLKDFNEDITYSRRLFHS